MGEAFNKLSAWFDKEGGNWIGQGAYMYKMSLKMMKYFLSKQMRENGANQNN